jgi:hypothetical protein
LMLRWPRKAILFPRWGEALRQRRRRVPQEAGCSCGPLHAFVAPALEAAGSPCKPGQDGAASCLSKVDVMCLLKVRAAERVATASECCVSECCETIRAERGCNRLLSDAEARERERWQGGGLKPPGALTAPVAHLPTDYMQWLDAQQPYEVRHMRGWRPHLIVQSGTPPFDEHVLDADCSLAAHSLHLYTAGYRFHVLPQVPPPTPALALPPELI